jgi:hypothetical protein
VRESLRFFDQIADVRIAQIERQLQDLHDTVVRFPGSCITLDVAIQVLNTKFPSDRPCCPKGKEYIHRASFLSSAFNRYSVVTEEPIVCAVGFDPAVAGRNRGVAVRYWRAETFYWIKWLPWVDVHTCPRKSITPPTTHHMSLDIM